MKSISWILSLVGFACIQAASYPFTDDFSAASGSWSYTGTWGLNQGTLTDSPGRLYENSSDTYAQLAAMDLSSVVRPRMVFHHRHFLEPGYDFASVEVSTQEGGPWMEIASYTGNQSVLVREQIDLSTFSGETSVRFRWRLRSDSSVVGEGWVLEGLFLDEAPPAPVLNAITDIQTNALGLSWSSVGPEVASLRIVRTEKASSDWKTWGTIATLMPESTGYLDISTSPKTTYTYRVVAMGQNGVEDVSLPQTATTLAGMTFPFLDDAEGGSGTWTATGEWALSDEDAHSGAFLWSDSPGKLYENLSNSAITLSAPLDLTGTSAPVLSFLHQFRFLNGDLGLVEVSENNGVDWVELARFTNGNVDQWQRERIELTAFAHSQQVLLRFRITTDGSGQERGWWLDDISVSESPQLLNGPSLTEVESHSIHLTWGVADALDFSHYAIHRSESANVSFQSGPVALITSRESPQWTDTGLSVDTVYFYRVFAVNRFGAYGPIGGENYVRTLNHPIPFEDDFEGDLTAWNVTGSWGLEPGSGVSGTYCLSDSPQTTYSHSSDSWAMTSVDLTDSVWPVLHFMDHIVLNSGDCVSVEVSTDGTTWIRVYGQYEVNRPEWREQRIDLSEWKTQSNLRVRFRLQSDVDPSTTALGWRVDTVQVREHTPVLLTLPLEEDFESGLTNWIAAAWIQDESQAYAGSGSAWSGESLQLPGASSVACQNRMNLGGELDFTGVSHPQLTLWVKARLWGDRGYFRVYVSENEGLSWTMRNEANLSNNYDEGWTRIQCDLTAYAGKRVRLRLEALTTRYSPEVQIQVDKLTVDSRPANVLLHGPVPSLKSVDLSWDRTELGAAFQRYELYRHTAPGVNLTHTKVASFSDPDQLAFTDTNLSIGQPYYYRLFQVDQRDSYSEGSERAVTTVPLILGFSDPMDHLANWDVNGTWGVDSADPYQGTASISDSPGDTYVHNQDSWALTAVNLSASTWPVLRFWDWLDLAAGDSVSVEVSTDGTNWIRVYGQVAVQRTEWRPQQIDLSDWKNVDNLRIRFRLQTDNNAATTAYGWKIDDLEMVEHTPVPLTLPFEEDFESGLTNWISAAWIQDESQAYAGGGSAWSGESLLLPGGSTTACQNRMNLGGELDFTGVSHPQLTLWVKARLWGERGYFRVYVSENEGLSWSVLNEATLSYNYDGDWTRIQCDLTAYAGKRVRLRLEALTTRYSPEVQIRVDKLTVDGRPANVLLHGPVPSLKSVDLSWDRTELGAAFQRYELYRHTAPGVNLTHTKVASFSDPDQLAFTDTNLSIGQPYYYRLFQVDQRDSYSEGSERAVTTVPLILGFSDPMDHLGNWDVNGTWGVDSAGPHQGTASISDSPGDTYVHNQDSWALTAVNLSGSTWPVLRFWDWLDLAAGDTVSVEVSADGTNWIRVYGQVAVQRTEWRPQQIDLSDWKNVDNLRIRFRLQTDNNAATTAYGWKIDDLEMVEHTPVPLTLPFEEDFESGLTNWISAAWIQDESQAYAGSGSAWSGESLLLPGGSTTACQNRMNLGGELDFTGLSHPQLTLWVKARIWGERGYFRVYISENEGLSWTIRNEATLSYHYDADWTRIQCDLTAYAGKRVRIRLEALTTRYAPEVQIRVDKLTVDERTADVTLNSAVPDRKSAVLQWTPTSLGESFQRYEIYRKDTPGVSLNDTRVGSIQDPNQLQMTDTGLVPGSTYYYRIFVFTDRDMVSNGSERPVTTLSRAVGFTDAFENLDHWAVTGDWGLEDGLGLVDSPHTFYAASTDTEARMSLNLEGSDWPLLRFTDRYDFAEGDGGWVEVSPDGSNWTRLYGVFQGRRDTWRENTLDFSEWKTQPHLRVRFRSFSDANAATTAEGWSIQAVQVVEHTPVALPLPFFEDFEAGADHWLRSDWSMSTDDPFQGNASLRDGGTDLSPGEYSSTSASYQRLVLSAPLDLRDVETVPIFSFRIKGQLSGSTYAFFRTQISSNGGLTWQDLPEASRNTGWSSDWEGLICDLSAHQGKVLRIRFQIYGYRNTPQMDLFLDNIGIGGPAPSAPTLLQPFSQEQVAILQPTLVLQNAFDPQSDPLSYEFEVYSDAELTQRVANVPSVASGETTTSWTLDQNLSDGGQYWWRARASDGAHPGPWSGVFRFTINHVNSPPHPVELVAPSRNALLQTLNGELIWREATDPDFGDVIIAYHLQIAEDAAFQNLLVNSDTLPAPSSGEDTPALIGMRLGDLPGAHQLERQRSYYWRMRAADASQSWSAWSAHPAWFQFGTPPLQLQAPLLMEGNQMKLQWNLTGAEVILQFTPTLDPADWQPMDSPTYDNAFILSLEPGVSTGFFRLAEPE